MTGQCGRTNRKFGKNRTTVRSITLDFGSYALFSFIPNSMELKPTIESPLMTSSPFSHPMKDCKSEVKEELNLESKHIDTLPKDIKPKRPRFVISDDSGGVSK